MANRERSPTLEAKKLGDGLNNSEPKGDQTQLNWNINFYGSTLLKILK